MLIKLSNYKISINQAPTHLLIDEFILSQKDVCIIKSDSSNQASLFLKSLATIVKPEKGVYYFKGEKVDFSDYRELLYFKKRISYISHESSLISNLKLKDNLLIIRRYFEDTVSPVIGKSTLKLCKMFNLHNKLDKLPGELNILDIGSAVLIREITKSPDLILLNRPEDFIGYKRMSLLIDLLRQKIKLKVPMIFFSHDKVLSTIFPNTTILISQEKVTRIS